MANQFNNYLVTVAEKLTKKIGETNNKYQDYLKNPNEHSMYLTVIQPDEIKTQLKKSKQQKCKQYLLYISKVSEIFR